jgi:hypothetical protein
VVIELADRDALGALIFQHYFDQDAKPLVQKARREHLRYPKTAPVNEVRRLVLNPELPHYRA